MKPKVPVTSTKTYSTSDPSIAAQEYTNAMQEYFAAISSQAQVVQADKQKEAMDATVAKWSITGGYGHNAQIQKAAKEALILFLVNSDYYKKNVNLKNASSSKIETMAVRIVKNVCKNFTSESEPIEHGGYKFKIWTVSQYGGFVASISLITPAYPNGNLVYMGVGNLEDVIADFMKQSVNLGWDAIEIAVEEVVKDLTGKTFKNTLKAATNNLLKLPKADGGFGFGDVNDALGKAWQIYKITSQIADVKKVPPDDPAKMYNWAKGVNDTANEYAFGNETLSDVVVGKAFKALKDARTELLNATTAYMTGTTCVPPGDPNKSWGQNVGDYFLNLIKCPVDVTVYGSGNQVLDYVRGNEVVINSNDIYIYKDGEFKGICYKKDANLRFELTGTAHGVLDVSVDEYTNNQPVKRSNYFMLIPLVLVGLLRRIYYRAKQIKEDTVRAMPPIEAPAKLIEIALQMKFIKAVKGALHEGFRVGNNRVQPGEHLLIGVENLPIVIVFLAQGFSITSQCVRFNGRAFGDSGTRKLADSWAFQVRNNPHFQELRFALTRVPISHRAAQFLQQQPRAFVANFQHSRQVSCR